MNPTAILGGLVLLIAVFFTGSHFGHKLERETWQKKEIATLAQHDAELNAEIGKRARDQSFNEAKARRASEQHEKALSDLKAAYAEPLAHPRGLRIPARPSCVGSPTAATEAPGTGRPDEAGAATEELPERTQERLYQLSLRADELAEQLRALQGWVKDNGFYGDSLLKPAPLSLQEYANDNRYVAQAAE